MINTDKFNRPKERTQWLILDLWKINPRLEFTAKEIARSLSLSVRTINTHLTSLLERGLLKKVVSLSDSRIYHYRLNGNE